MALACRRYVFHPYSYSPTIQWKTAQKLIIDCSMPPCISAHLHRVAHPPHDPILNLHELQLHCIPTLYFGTSPQSRSSSARSHPQSSSDRKSTRLNSSHTVISYAVFCLKKKK